jgi:23S rRNA (uracil1939-C5)-methyltransferase
VAVALAARPVAAILYVSCDPPTLGRDLATLTEAGYVVEALETFELFPQTSHVETVALLTHPKKQKKS